MTAKHEELYQAVKSAAGAEAKIDLLIDFIKLFVVNDINSLEKEVAALNKWKGRVCGIVAAVVFLASLVGPIIVKIVLKKLGVNY